MMSELIFLFLLQEIKAAFARRVVKDKETSTVDVLARLEVPSATASTTLGDSSESYFVFKKKR